MNRNVLQMNRDFARQPIDQATMEQAQRNNKRTVIDTNRVDMKRMMELMRLKFPWLVTRGNSDHARIYVWENKNY